MFAPMCFHHGLPAMRSRNAMALTSAIAAMAPTMTLGELDAAQHKGHQQRRLSEAQDHQRRNAGNEQAGHQTDRRAFTDDVIFALDYFGRSPPWRPVVDVSFNPVAHYCDSRKAHRTSDNAAYSASVADFPR
jgi:hypothetical protein